MTEANLNATTSLRVGIVGAGPAGLAAAIFLRRLPNVDVRLYEQARELREVGAGIHIQENTYRLIDLLGAREALERKGSSRTSGQASKLQHINGLTLEVVKETDTTHAPINQKPARFERTSLQAALLEQVPADLVQLRKRLQRYEQKADSPVTLFFEDGKSEQVDLLVGADGLRSAVRTQAFPDCKLSYTGQIAFRTLVPFDLVKDIPQLPDATVFVWGPTSHVFLTQVGNGRFEITTRALVPDGKHVSWGQDAVKEDFLKYFTDFHPTIRAVLDAAPSTGWRQFAMFGASRLDSVIAGKVALLGDASHPLSGAFGSGAGFAFEDAYVLYRSIELAQNHKKPLSYALQLYDSFRSPHYAALYNALPTPKPTDPSEPFSEALQKRIEGAFGKSAWIYQYDVAREWQEARARGPVDGQRQT